MKRRVLSVLLALCMAASLFAGLQPRVYAQNITSGVSGSNFTNNTTLANKLNNVFNGTAKLFSNTTATFALGESLNIDKSYTVAKVISGYQCYIYANGAYYYLFGDVPYHGTGYSSSYFQNSVTLDSFQGVSTVSYNAFKAARVGVGAYIRTTNKSNGAYNGSAGHSMILLGYNENYIWILHGNANNNGLVCVTKSTWNEFNNTHLTSKSRRISHIVQPTSTLGEQLLYTINFDANGGTGTMNPLSVTYGERFMIPQSGFTKSGFEQIGWNLRRNADNKYYVAGQGWFTEGEISVNGYQKNLYSLDRSLTFDNSWLNGYDGVSTYTYISIWEQSACSHDYQVTGTTAATCTAEGSVVYTCGLCGESYTVAIDALGHQYQSTHQDATCVNYGVTTYTCTVCGYSYSVPEDDEYSEWSTSYPADANNNTVESATGYRYRLLETTTGSESPLEGWTDAGSEWIQTDGGSVQYVASWPAGFNTSNAYYSQYHNAPVTANETETQKTSVDSDSVIGYLYWHWCRNSYTDGPDNRRVEDHMITSSDPLENFTGFHCFFSTTPPDGLQLDSSGTVRKYANASCCKDTYWYFALPVRQQDYQMLEKLYHFERWSEWSDWDTEVIEETATCDVETATIYRYATSLLEGHQWGEWTVVTEPTCTVDGQRSRTCTVCGETETEAIPAAHNWDENEQFCTVCGALNPDYIALCVAPASGTVQPGESVTIPVSITDNTGFAGFTFIITCDEGLSITNITKGALLSTSESGSFTKNIESGKVTWYDVENLTNDGVLFNLVLTLSANAEPGEYGITIALKDSQPTNFVDYLSQAVPIRFTAGKVVYNDHTHSYTAVTTAPTCTEAGAIVYTCECGDTYSETLEPLGHLPGEATEEVTTPATCTASGSGYAVVYCERCNIELSREAIVLPALGHDYVETVLIPVTCTEDGASQFTCSRCGDSYTQIIPALGHIFEDEVLIPATCTEEGAILRTCSRCNYQTTEFVAPLGHNYAEEVLIAATCTDDGASQFTCSRCGDTKTEVIPSLGHLLEQNVTEPSCEEDGSIVETCARCDYTHTEVLPALGHDYVGTVLLEPTCTARGVIRYTCSRCSKQYSEFVPATHDLHYTDNSDGTHTAACSRCDYSITEAHTYTDGVCICGATELVPKIKSATLVLDEDIDIIYAIEIPDGFTNPYLVINGTEIREYYERDGKLCFVYAGITPQCMGDSITAVLHVNRNSQDVTDTVANYSVKQYCINQLANHPEDTVLKTLLADLLCYGAAAQQYTNYRTDSLVTSGLDLTPSAFSEISNKTASFTGTADTAVDWIGAGLILGNSVSMRLTFAADSTENLNITVAINGREQSFTAEDFTNAGGGKYYIDFCGINADEFDDAVTASFSRSGKSVGRVLSYTVNAYVCSTQNSDNASLQTLVKALYNYGVSALAYAESQ